MTHTIQAQIAENNVTFQAQIETQIAPSGGVEVEAFSTSENGTFAAPQGKAYSPVSVSVPQTEVVPLSVSENGTTTAPAGKAYNPVTVEVPIKAEESLTVEQNGTYTPEAGKVYNRVVANVPNTYAAADEGKVVSGGALVAQTARTVTENGTVDTTLNNSVTVNVSSKEEIALTATANGTYTPPSGKVYSSATVKVPWLMQGPNPVENLGVIYEKETALKDTGYASWTPSTTQFIIQASADLQPVTLNAAQYEYFAMWEFDFVPVYSDGTPMVAAVSRVIGVLCGLVSRRQNTVDDLRNGVFNNMANVLLPIYGETVYYGLNGAIALYSGLTAGVYLQNSFPTISNAQSDTPNLTLKTPAVLARCDTARFSTSSASAIDKDKSKFALRCTLCRTPFGGLSRQMYAELTALYNNPIVSNN